MIGGTVLIGRGLVPLLKTGGHDVVTASPASGVNAVTGEGLPQALEGAQVVVDVANSPSFADDDVMAFFDKSTRNLLAAEAKSGTKHHVALSAVAKPWNGMCEVAGPDKVRISDIVSRALAAAGDKRAVVVDAKALYFGTELNDASLTPGAGARLGTTHYDDWLKK